MVAVKPTKTSRYIHTSPARPPCVSPRGLILSNALDFVSSYVAVVALLEFAFPS